MNIVKEPNYFLCLNLTHHDPLVTSKLSSLMVVHDALFPVPGILQARVLEWGAIVFSNIDYYIILIGLPRWLSGKESACQCRSHRRCGFYPSVVKIPWRRKWQPTPIFLPEESHGHRSLVGYGTCGQNIDNVSYAVQWVVIVFFI